MWKEIEKKKLELLAKICEPVNLYFEYRSLRKQSNNEHNHKVIPLINSLLQ